MSQIIELTSPCEHISVFQHDATAWVTLNRPERRNALNEAMWRAIPPIIEELDANSAVRAIVLRGAGKEAFAAGADISEFSKNRSGASAAREYEKINVDAMMALANAQKPVIAMIHGFCIGGGLALALACDIRIAADTAVFALPPARLGLAYPIEGIRQLLNVISPAVAREMIFTGRRMNTDEALNAGLVNQIVTREHLQETVEKVTSTIAENAPLSIIASKKTIAELLARPENPDIALLEEWSARCFESNDYAEGQEAFAEKRKPRFSGN